MKAIKQLSKKIDEQRGIIARLYAEIARVERAANAVPNSATGVEEARARKKAALVAAFREGGKPDLSAIEAEIASAEKLQVAEKDRADAAREALEAMKSGCEAAEDDLATLQAERQEAVSKHLISKHEDAQNRYFAAVAALGGPVQEMVAIERVWGMAMSGKEFPARGSRFLADVRDDGLRVTWDHSALRRPEIAALYTDDYRDGWYVPEWADLRAQSVADEPTVGIVNELKSAGLDVILPERPAEKNEPLVEIEVVRGQFGSGYVSKLDPNGGLVRQKAPVFGVGRRLKVSKSTADSSVQAGLAKYVAVEDIEHARDRYEEQKKIAASNMQDEPLWSPLTQRVVTMA